MFGEVPLEVVCVCVSFFEENPIFGEVPPRLTHISIKEAREKKGHGCLKFLGS